MIQFDEGIWLSSDKVESLEVREEGEGWAIEVTCGGKSYQRTCEKQVAEYLVGQFREHCR